MTVASPRMLPPAPPPRAATSPAVATGAACSARRRAAAAALLAAGLALGVPVARAAPPDEATEVVATTLDQMLGILRDKAMPAEERRRRVEDIAYEHFDFDTISRLVLARNWSQLSAQQQADFVVEFKRHLSGTYWQTLEDYGDQRVEVTGARPEQNGDVTVLSQVESDGPAPIRLDYRMRDDSGRWAVIDVIIDGVSLVQNFRSQTQAIISDVGVDGLIERLREKNAASPR